MKPATQFADKSDVRTRIQIALVVALLTEVAAAGTIVSVGRRLRMTNAEPLPPKDFYVDLGQREGLREGDVLTVSRQIVNVHDRVGSPTARIRITLGELTVIAVGEGGSYARQASLRAPSELPFMDSPGFMTGDEVQTKSGLPFR